MTTGQVNEHVIESKFKEAATLFILIALYVLTSYFC